MNARSDETTVSRRAMLRLGRLGVLLSVVATSGGGLALPPADEERPGPPYRSWVYGPETVSRADHAAFFALDLDTVLAREDALRRFTARKYRSYVGFPSVDGLGLRPESVDSLVLVYPASGGATPWSIALVGSFERRRLEPTLRARFDESETHGSCGLHWGGTEANVAVGVDDGFLVAGYETDVRHEREVLERAIDARRDGTARYAGSDADFARLVEALGPGHDVNALTHDRITDADPGRDVFAGQVAKGHRYVFGAEESESRYAFVFAAERDADTAAVEAWVRANEGPDDRLFGAYRDATVTRRGRAVVVDGTLPTDEI